MPRAIWKGSISFGLVQIPVGLYAAEQPQELRFSMLDRRNMGQVGYERINKQSGEPVPWEEIVRGYEYDEGQYIIISDEDFRRANVKATQTVDIIDFVDAEQISPLYFEKPYYLAPSKRGAAKSYALLRETMRRTGKVGIAKVVIRKRQHLAALMPLDNVLVLDLLRFHHELRSTDDLDVPGESLQELGVSAKELKMAEQLVAGMSEGFDPAHHHDDYRADLMALIDERVKAGAIEATPEPAPTADEVAGGEVVDLLALLKRSIENKPQRQAKRAPKRAAKKSAGKTNSKDQTSRRA